VTPLDFFRENGVKIFPVNGKDPAVSKGNDWADWDDFVRPRPVNYGVVLGSLTVVDGDCPAATVWIRANLPPTPFRVQTGPHHDGSFGRGVHFYYRTSADLPAYIYRPDLIIEKRRFGQYVVGPGSRHPSGCTYRPTDWSWRWEDLPFFPADFDCGQPLSGGDGRPYEYPTQPVPRGARHDELFKCLRHLKSLYVFDEAKRRAWLFATNDCDPPLTKADFKSEGWDGYFARSWNHRDRPGFYTPIHPEQPLDPPLGINLDVPDPDLLRRC
jgi:hypothetical protein